MFKILLPVDFTETSDNACAYALHLAASRPQAELLLLHCFNDYLLQPELEDPLNDTGRSPLSPGSEEITDRVMHRNQTEEHAKLDALYNQLQLQAREQGMHVQMKRAFINGMPEDVIPEEIERYKPSLLLMGTKGEDDLARSLFGTVTTKMVSEAPVPLLTVPERYSYTGLQRVLFASDFGAADAQALAALQQLVEPMGASIHCVHVSSATSARKDQQKLEELRQQLEQTYTAANVKFILLEDEDRDVANTLLEHIEAEQVQLLAVSTQERGFWSSLFHSSLTKELVLELSAPMLVFHSPKGAS